MINTLSLPVDVPWTRLGVYEDMIDRNICDRAFPLHWQSSVAIFSYEPPADSQNIEGMIVSYLKVVCSITGYQPEPDQVGTKDRRASWYWSYKPVIDYLQDKLKKYYACYGAILDVAVGPSKDQKGIEKVYIADFEPKKRELYETVSETGEVLSRSLEDINIQKGSATTISHEVLDIDKGFSLGASYAGTGGSFSHNYESGPRDMNQQQYNDVRTTDTSREKRESLSHTTQLTQMYHQLTSYHLGTNRAVFFMLPRPHIVQAEHITFVNGPRHLEGIQEIFLVVMRPKKIESLCVEAYLQTAHINREEIELNPELETMSKPLRLKFESPAITADEDTAYPLAKTEVCPADPGWEVDMDREGGPVVKIIDEGAFIEDHWVKHTKEGATAFAKIVGYYGDQPLGKEDIYNHAWINMDYTVYFRRKKEVKKVESDKDLYIIGRGVCCCFEPVAEAIVKVNRLPLGVDYEKQVPSWEIPVYSADHKDIPEPGVVSDRRKGVMTVRDSNRLITEIGDLMRESINDPDRYPRSTVGFAETQFLARRIAKILNSNKQLDNQNVKEITGLDPAIRKKVLKVNSGLKRSDLLEMSPMEQSDRFTLSAGEVTKLRRSLLGVERPGLNPKERWDRPGDRKLMQTVPDVVGIPLQTATSLIDEAQFRIGKIIYRDSDQSRGTVLSQTPASGTSKLSKSAVDVIVASGASVRLPDIVGKTLTQALILLGEAGLKTEPELIFVNGQSKNLTKVLKMVPKERTYVTPRHVVSLTISSPQKMHEDKTAKPKAKRNRRAT